MLRAVVFDLDETLISSKDAIVNFFRSLYAELNKPFPEDLRRHLYTAPEKGLIERLFPEPEIREAARRFKERFTVEDHIRALTLKPYALQTVRDLAGHYQLAVATNRGDTTEPVLVHFGLRPYFEEVIHARSLSFPKPHPVVMETIMERLGVTADETILVGDSEVDVDTGHNVRVPVILVGPEAPAGLADHYLQDLSFLPAFLDDLTVHQD